MGDDAATIEGYYFEGRTFAPSAEFVASAVENDPAISGQVGAGNMGLPLGEVA